MTVSWAKASLKDLNQTIGWVAIKVSDVNGTIDGDNCLAMILASMNSNALKYQLKWTDDEIINQVLNVVGHASMESGVNRERENSRLHENPCNMNG